MYICNMDEDEELYREMDEEDPFYMGDKDDDDDEYEEEDDKRTQKKNNVKGGCLSMFLMVIALFLIASIL